MDTIPSSSLLSTWRSDKHKLYFKLPHFIGVRGSNAWQWGLSLGVPHVRLRVPDFTAKRSLPSFLDKYRRALLLILILPRPTTKYQTNLPLRLMGARGLPDYIPVWRNCFGVTHSTQIIFQLPWGWIFQLLLGAAFLKKYSGCSRKDRTRQKAPRTTVSNQILFLSKFMMCS